MGDEVRVGGSLIGVDEEMGRGTWRMMWDSMRREVLRKRR